MNIFITGSNRGLGLEFVKKYVEREDRVFASCRNPVNASDLQKLRNNFPDQLTILPLDVANPKSAIAARTTVEQHVDHLDLLINNAGMGTRQLSEEEYNQYSRIEDLNSRALDKMFQVNSFGPIIVAKSLLPLLSKAKNSKIINISSLMGSVKRNSSGGEYAYKASKAALNMLTRTLSFDVLPMGIIAVAVSPGWVRTDMGGPSATFSIQESVSNLIHLIDGLGKAQSGRFFNYNGQELDW